MTLKAPFPWFGGKSRVADVVWDRFGNVPNYVEPFAGSLAILLSRPHAPKNETVNDLDAYLSNFWRALSADPEAVAAYADWPVNEADLHARHRWLVDQKDFRETMLTDPEFYDARIAGWWVWGISQWIGSGWCAKPKWRGRGGNSKRQGVHRQEFHRQQPVDDTWLKRPALGRGGRGTQREHGRRTHLSDSGQGVHRKLPRQDNTGVHRQIPDISGDAGASGRGIFSQAVAEQIPYLSRSMGVHREDGFPLLDYMYALAARLRRVRVCCGDWKRILGPSPTTKIGLTAVFLDPPYAVEDRADCYNHESRDLAHAVRAWAVENGQNPELRIALCGYEGEHQMPHDWECVAWKANGGYANRGTSGTSGKANAHLERVWFSPACLKPGLFSLIDVEEKKPDTCPAFDHVSPQPHHKLERNLNT